ncbi:HEAT repeat domain-containing protein [Singulisphaera sp. PoT]|uniref:HEAT repeat domain-containing protein n=1 Tax=Singulisphaera sp. PoT TaxID=3411797 RepID=UPI003BF58C72
MNALVSTLIFAVGSILAAAGDEPPMVLGRSVDGWVQILRNKGSAPGARLRALKALAFFGAEAKAAVPDLVEEFRRGLFRAEAVDALVRIGAETDLAVSYLIDQLVKDQNVAWVSPDRGDVRKNLARIGGPAVPELIRLLSWPERRVRGCAADVLGRIGPGAKEAVPALIRNFGDDQHDQIFPIALGQIGPDAKAAVPALNRLLEQDRDDSGLIVNVLGKIGSPPVAYLMDRFPGEGGADLVSLLAGLGPGARDAAPRLRRWLADPSPRVRIAAAVALSGIDPTAKEAIPVLIEALRHRVEPGIPEASQAPQALARFGPDAKAALPKLIDIIRLIDEIGMTRVLVQIDPEGKECVPALISTLNSNHAEHAKAAAEALGLLGPAAGDAVPALAARLTRGPPIPSPPWARPCGGSGREPAERSPPSSSP